jgi:site-specific recombinase XerD
LKKINGYQKNGDRLRALRDKALLFLGFAAALRRSELCALEVSGRTSGAV